MIKSKSLGTLQIGNPLLSAQSNIHLENESVGKGVHLAHVSVKQVRSYPLLASLTTELDEKRVRFTPVNSQPHLGHQGDVQNGDKSVQNLTTQHEGDKNANSNPLPSIATTVTFPSTVMVDPPPLTSTPQHEIESESHCSNSFDFGSILNADQLPPTASAVPGGEEILGVSALSGDYYSMSVDPSEGRVSVLSQHSNVLPEEFESNSMMQLGLHTVQSESSVTGMDQYESPLAHSTPAINASSDHSISRPQHSGSSVHQTTASPPAKAKKPPSSSVQNSPEQDVRRCSLFSSSQYGSIVSAAQSTSISCVGSERMDSVASESPPPHSTLSPSGRELVPLCTQRDSINVLLQRGADPNLSPIPLPPLFYAIRAGDVEAVEILLKGGANTEICLPLEVCLYHSIVGDFTNTEPLLLLKICRMIIVHVIYC